MLNKTLRNHILKRAGQAVGVLLAAYTLAFTLLSALPGDAVNNRIQDPEAQISPEAAQVLLEYYGLDRPLWQQYLTGLGDALRGDFGYSVSTGQPVTSMIGHVLPSTLQLTGLALLFGIVISAVVAIAINYAPTRWVRGIVEAAPPLFASVPTFVVGILALQVLSFRLHLIPASDDGSFTAVIAPALTLAILISAPLSQVFATSIARTRDQPFMHVLAARGAGEGYAFRHGVLRNSSLPVLTLLALACGELIAGSMVTEYVFARQGIGQMTVSAVTTQDLPVVQGVVVLAAAAYVFVNFLVDVAYPLLDPRILADEERARAAARGGLVSKINGLAKAAAGRVGSETPSRPALPADVAMP